MEIRDPVSGRGAGVNSDGRLGVRSVTSLLSEFQAFKGESFRISTGAITLTSASLSGLLYIKSTDQNNELVIPSIVVGFGKSTGGNPGAAKLTVYSNSSTGTLISGASALTPGNANLGITTPAQATVYVGVEGSTITNGSVWDVIMVRDLYDETIPLGIVIPTGQAVAFAITPPASNTSMVVTLSASMVLIDDGDTQVGG